MIAMATFFSRALTITYVLLLCIQISLALQCYTCSSARDEFCDDTFSYTSLANVPMTICENSPIISIPGAGPNTHCGKSKRHDVRSQDYIMRGCVPENYCKLVKSSMSECELCENERCNSAASISPSIVFFALALLFNYLKL